MDIYIAKAPSKHKDITHTTARTKENDVVALAKGKGIDTSGPFMKLVPYIAEYPRQEQEQITDAIKAMEKELGTYGLTSEIHALHLFILSTATNDKKTQRLICPLFKALHKEYIFLINYDRSLNAPGSNRNEQMCHKIITFQKDCINTINGLLHAGFEKELIFTMLSEYSPFKTKILRSMTPEGSKILPQFGDFPEQADCLLSLVAFGLDTKRAKNLLDRISTLAYSKNTAEDSLSFTFSGTAEEPRSLCSSLSSFIATLRKLSVPVDKKIITYILDTCSISKEASGFSLDAAAQCLEELHACGFENDESMALLQQWASCFMKTRATGTRICFDVFLNTISKTLSEIQALGIAKKEDLRELFKAIPEHMQGHEIQSLPEICKVLKAKKYTPDTAKQFILALLKETPHNLLEITSTSVPLLLKKGLDIKAITSSINLGLIKNLNADPENLSSIVYIYFMIKRISQDKNIALGAKGYFSIAQALLRYGEKHGIDMTEDKNIEQSAELIIQQLEEFRSKQLVTIDQTHLFLNGHDLSKNTIINIAKDRWQIPAQNIIEMNYDRTVRSVLKTISQQNSKNIFLWLKIHGERDNGFWFNTYEYIDHKELGEALLAAHSNDCIIVMYSCYSYNNALALCEDMVAHGRKPPTIITSSNRSKVTYAENNVTTNEHNITIHTLGLLELVSRSLENDQPLTGNTFIKIDDEDKLNDMAIFIPFRMNENAPWDYLEIY